MQRKIRAAWVTTIVVLCGVPRANAATVLYNSSGFEPTTFSAGQLEGQDPVNGPWLRSGSNGSTADVRTSANIPVQAGTQAVQVTRAAANGSDARWAVLETVLAVTDPILIEWDMRVVQSGGAQPFGPFFGIETYDGNGGFLVAGTAGIDAKTGEVLYQATGTGSLTVAGAPVAFDTWHHFEMTLNFTTNTYSVLVNGSPRVTNEGFVDPGIENFTDADIATTAAGGDAASLAAGGTAYFDNYRVSLVPEPAAAGILAAGIVGLLARRSRRG